LICPTPQHQGNPSQKFSRIFGKMTRNTTSSFNFAIFSKIFIPLKKIPRFLGNVCTSTSYLRSCLVQFSAELLGIMCSDLSQVPW
jgi:hypothetical protein